MNCFIPACFVKPAVAFFDQGGEFGCRDQEVPCQGQTAGEPGSAGTVLCGSISPFPGGI